MIYEIRHIGLANTGETGKGEQTMRDRTHDEAMVELYQENPAYAVELLNSILEDGDESELLIVLRQIAKAHGGVQAIAEQAHLNPMQLDHTLSSSGSAALSNVSAILKAMDLCLAVRILRTPAMHDEVIWK